MTGLELSFPLQWIQAGTLQNQDSTFVLHFVVTKRRNSHLDHAGRGGGADVRQEGNMTAPARKHWVRLRERILQLLLLFVGNPQSIPTLLYFCIKLSSLPYGIFLSRLIPVEVHEPKACRRTQAFVLALSNNIFNWVMCKQTPNKDLFLLICRLI